MGAITSIQWGKRFDSGGSDKQMDFCDDKIRCLISSTDASWKNENEGGGLPRVENVFKLIMKVLNE